MVDWAAHQDDLMSKFLKDQDREPLNSSLPHIASVVQKAASEEFDNVNLVSCALVLKDLIYIDFSPEKMREFTPWNRCAFADEGLLAGCYRTACGTEGIERITVFPNKKAFLDVPQLTQRAEFIRNPDLKSLCVAPLVIGDSSIGSINISFRSELSDAQAAKVKLWLDEAAGSLKWLFYSEHIRLNNIWDMAQGLIASLQRRSGYQAHHCQNVADIVNLILMITSTHPDLAHLLHDGKNVSGLSFFEMRVAALLHDVGKVTIRLPLLDVWEPDMKKVEDVCERRLHPYHTYRILDAAQATKGIAMLAAQHHEYENGLGFPFGLAPPAVGIKSQIIAFADAFDAIARERPNKISRGYFADVLKEMDTSEKIRVEGLYLKLLTILKEFVETGSGHRKLLATQELVFRRLIGYGAKKPPVRWLAQGSELDELFLSKRFRLGAIRMDMWWVLFAISYEQCEKQELSGEQLNCAYVEIDNVVDAVKRESSGDRTKNWTSRSGWSWRAHLVPVKNQPGCFMGAHKPRRKRERAYAFCEDVSNKLPSGARLAAVILDRTHINEFGSIREARDQLLSAIGDDGGWKRWRLLG